MLEFEIFISSFLVVFLAEMGDKTQLIAMSFSAQYGIITVLTSVLSAVLINTLIAVTAGSLIFNIADKYILIIKLVSYLLFIGFGVYPLLVKNKKSQDDEGKKRKVIINPFITIMIFFILSELGDKTQIVTVLLTVQNSSVIPVFLGASAGLFSANLIAISAAALIGKKVPSWIMEIISTWLFIAIGVIGAAITLPKLLGGN
jgi:putative Ca2+/H+ antiporter (TMEM165/GDT1 family)